MAFIYNGKSYSSLRAAAKEYGLDYRRVWSRLKSGKTLDEAFQSDRLKKPGQSKKICVAGHWFGSITEAAKHYGVNPRTVHGRLAKGLTPEQALGIEVPKAGNKLGICVDGKDFSSIADASRYFGIDPTTAYSRLRRGKSSSEVFATQPLERKTTRDIKIEVGGKRFDNLKLACEFFGIAYSKARYRFRKKWTPEQIFGLETPPANIAKNAPKKIVVKGITYDSLTHVAKVYSVDPNLLARRLRMGWDMENALNLVDTEYPTKPKKVKIRNVEFASRNEAARHFGVNIGTVADRVNYMGWSLEQALELAPPPAGFHTNFGVVYLITNIANGMQYVGITLRNPPNKRFDEHIANAAKPKRFPQGGLAEAICEFGAESFSFEVLATASSQAELQKLEKQKICELGTLSPDGYNLSAGGTIGKVPGRSIELKSLNLKFSSIADASRHFGVNAATIIHRLNQGYTLEQCVGIEPLRHTGGSAKSIKVGELKFSSIKEAAQHFGHPPNRVRNRLYAGWTLEEALSTPYAAKSKEVVIDNVKYPSIRAAARALGVSHDALRKMLKQGLS